MSGSWTAVQDGRSGRPDIPSACGFSVGTPGENPAVAGISAQVAPSPLVCQGRRHRSKGYPLGLWVLPRYTRGEPTTGGDIRWRGAGRREWTPAYAAVLVGVLNVRDARRSGHGVDIVWQTAKCHEDLPGHYSLGALSRQYLSAQTSRTVREVFCLPQESQSSNTANPSSEGRS